jgi:hypothetical protein
MNATLAPTETRHPVQQPQQGQPVRRVGLADRAALHLGVALIKWGRRPVLGTAERRANALERALAHRARDARVQAHRDQALLQYNLIHRIR